MIRCVSGPLHNHFSSENGLQFIDKASGELYVKVQLEAKNQGPSFIEYFCYNKHSEVLTRGCEIKYCFLCLGYPVMKDDNCDYSYAQWWHEQQYKFALL